MHRYVSASQLRPGDKIITGSGHIRPLRSITPGFWRGSLLLSWRDGWSCIHKTTEVAVAR